MAGGIRHQLCERLVCLRDSQTVWSESLTCTWDPVERKHLYGCGSAQTCSLVATSARLRSVPEQVDLLKFPLRPPWRPYDFSTTEQASNARRQVLLLQAADPTQLCAHRCCTSHRQAGCRLSRRLMGPTLTTSTCWRRAANQTSRARRSGCRPASARCLPPLQQPLSGVQHPSRHVLRQEGPESLTG